MNKTKIEWVRNPDGSQGYTWNPVTGCLNGCPYCYARKFAHRLGKTPEERRFEPVLHLGRIDDPVKLKKPNTIFVCSMGELFGDWVPPYWQEAVVDTVKVCAEHTFILLTKCPWNLLRWNPWPSNAWVGATCDGKDFPRIAKLMRQVEAKVRFISFEPLLREVTAPDLLY
jgi:protein gp37